MSHASTKIFHVHDAGSLTHAFLDLHAGVCLVFGFHGVKAQRQCAQRENPNSHNISIFHRRLSVVSVVDESAMPQTFLKHIVFFWKIQRQPHVLPDAHVGAPDNTHHT
jgi:hypothetical protein